MLLYIITLLIIWLAYTIIDDIDLFMALHDYKYFKKRVACKFSSVMYLYFNAQDDPAATKILKRHRRWIGWFVEFVCDECAAELVSEADLFMVALLVSHRTFEPSSESLKSLVPLCTGCYRNFMGIVMQLRMLGEIESSASVDEFRRSMEHLIELKNGLRDPAPASQPSI